MDEDLLTQFPNDIQSLCEKGQEYVTFYNLEEALVHYRQALDHIESISTPCDNIDRLRCDIYLHICYIYTLKNQWETAKSYYDIGKYLADKLQDKIRIAHYLDKQALILRWQGDFDKALECCGKSLDIKINYLGTYLHTDVAHSYHQLARIYDDGGKYQESLAMIRKAREIRLKVLDENHPDIAYSYHTEGIFYVRQGNFKKALSMLNIAHKIRLRLFGNRHLLIANSLQIMAVCRSYLGQHKVAFTMLNNVLYIRLALLSKNHAHIADTYEHMGDVGSNNGDYQQAISKYNLSLDMRHTIFPQKNHFAIARAYRKFGNVYVKQGQYNLASGILEKSLQMQLSTLNRDHPEIAKTLFGIAKIYIDLNRYEDALSIYNKSMQIRPSAVDFDYSFIAELYNGQGVIYKEQGKYDEALSMFHKTIKAILPALGENHPYVKMTRNHVATTRQQQQAHYYQSTTLAERYFDDLVRWFGVFTGTDANNLTTLTNRNSNGSNPDSDIIRHTEDEVLGEKKYYNLYNKALNNCYCFNDLIHGKFIGPPSIGKSSIAKVFTQQESNKNKPPDKVVNHSDGILKTEFNQFYCLQNSKTYNFTEVLDDKIKTAIREFSVAELESQQNNDMQKSNKSQQDQLTMADNLSLTIVKDDDKQSSMSSDNIADASNKTESKFSFAESYAPRINENKDKFEDNQYVKVWDFSDPAIYHVCQYLFRSSNSIYFLVFSIEQGVKDLVKTREGQLLNMTYSQAIQELLVSIICYHSSRNQVYVNIDDRDAEFSLPIIILVASHSDCTTEVKNEIVDMMSMSMN
ncbi:uncharacterized protein TRIADDRAFT_59496 [Trichoplax adhaerens]|uniref:Kinesin light chain n=1 Tax=Trichoplax adhaerens TaxID=10228 RepID=B3S5K5_TRIAD|nr:hypothetical protein TRIADDRAFT_59496 [Trichoplax adhaerens]EDV21971.1 hypothetical protein TRIADDRAFT_59496 [Trichoplax adhaerens]|eukprot:XP_002115608.1 hypothetical protein TRIADDRAFT_59496 [Trichoplax adhaerens]